MEMQLPGPLGDFPWSTMAFLLVYNIIIATLAALLLTNASPQRLIRSAAGRKTSSWLVYGPVIPALFLIAELSLFADIASISMTTWAASRAKSWPSTLSLSAESRSKCFGIFSLTWFPFTVRSAPTPRQCGSAGDTRSSIWAARHPSPHRRCRSGCSSGAR